MGSYVSGVQSNPPSQAPGHKKMFRWLDGSVAGIGVVLFSYVYMFILIIQLTQCHRVAALLTSLSFSALGGLLGFLFGVPRAPQSDALKNGRSQEGAPTGPGVQLAVNTNLEQISDWLTKLLVGLGLVELREIPVLLRRMTSLIAPVICVDGQPAEVLSLAIILSSSIFGFSFAYMATRLYLARAFKQADEDLQRTAQTGE